MQDPYYAANTWDSTSDSKREWTLSRGTGPLEDGRYRQWDGWTLLMGIKKARIRLRYPRTTSGIRYLDKASIDLKCLVAGAIAGLVPLGILADKLEEEYPDLSEQANHLRKWEQVNKERQ